MILVAGALSSEEEVAPLAGQPRTEGACGPSHVHPHLTHPHQLPQYQTHHRRLSLTFTHSGLNLPSVTPPLTSRGPEFRLYGVMTTHAL
ncbi:hypothetical protein SRHO_G00031280 [Serrasalmus rhombeus]